ncbi:GntR family transcriptional regulator [Streptomyces triticisoli]|uniref:GntR family transcriptional regulator n=1 Tax=Streptomyces triticisoli TaxID=2182797 RepID=UPI002FCD876E
MRGIRQCTDALIMDLDRTRAAWPQIRDVILQRIKDGTYPPGSKVPSVIQVATEFGVANSTAQRAMDAVKAQGLTRSEKGIGTFVL